MCRRCQHSFHEDFLTLYGKLYGNRKWVEEQRTACRGRKARGGRNQQPTRRTWRVARDREWSTVTSLFLTTFFFCLLYWDIITNPNLELFVLSVYPVYCITYFITCKLVSRLAGCFLVRYVHAWYTSVIYACTNIEEPQWNLINIEN